jgi:hypothetical protein
MEPVDCTFLSTVPPAWFLHILLTVTFPNLAGVVIDAVKGTLEEKTARNLARGRDSARTEKVSVHLLLLTSADLPLVPESS